MLLLCLGATGAVAFFILKDWTYTLRITPEEIERTLVETFPMERRYLLLFDVSVTDPLVELTEGSDRVGLGARIDLAPIDYRLGFKEKIHEGTLDVESRIELNAKIRYAPETGEFFLDESEIEQLSLEGFPDAFREGAEPFLVKVLDAGLRTRPVYTLRATDTRKALSKLVLRWVGVENGDLVIVLGL